MGIDSGGCSRIGVTEAGGDGGDRDAGVDHQGCVGMAQAVDGDIRQVVRSYEITEPTKRGTPKSPAFWGKEESHREDEAYQPDMPAEHSERRRRIRMDRRTVRFGEQPVAVYPSVAHRKASLRLPPLILLE